MWKNFKKLFASFKEAYMENKEPKIDYKKLTPEQRDKLEMYTMNVKKTRKLEDIATLLQEVIYIAEEYKEKSTGDTKSLGALFVDIRESIKQLVGKENPQYDDKKVVEALKKLDSNFVEAIKGLEVAPQVNVAAPDVTVQAPKVDLSELKTATEEGYKLVAEAIANIPPVDIPKYPDRTDEVLEILQSIDTASRLKPEFPTQIKVLNPDGSSIGSLSGSTVYESRNDTTTDTNLVYLGKALPGSATSDAAWQIKRYNKSAGTMTFADDVTTFTKTWDDRTSYTY